MQDMPGINRQKIDRNCAGYAHCQYHCCHLPLPPGPVFKPLKIGNHFIVQLLPTMVAKGKGAVINIASLEVIFPDLTWPSISPPSTTCTPSPRSKVSFFLFLTFSLQSLALELEGTGVLIQEIDPGVVNTEMTKVTF